MYRVTLAALTLRAAGGKALHLSQRFGLRPGTQKVRWSLFSTQCKYKSLFLPEWGFFIWDLNPPSTL